MSSPVHARLAAVAVRVKVRLREPQAGAWPNKRAGWRRSNVRSGDAKTRGSLVASPARTASTCRDCFRALHEQNKGGAPRSTGQVRHSRVLLCLGQLDGLLFCQLEVRVGARWHRPAAHGTEPGQRQVRSWEGCRQVAQAHGRKPRGAGPGWLPTGQLACQEQGNPAAPARPPAPRALPPAFHPAPFRPSTPPRKPPTPHQKAMPEAM